MELAFPHRCRPAGEFGRRGLPHPGSWLRDRQVVAMRETFVDARKVGSNAGSTNSPAASRLPMACWRLPSRRWPAGRPRRAPPGHEERLNPPTAQSAAPDERHVVAITVIDRTLLDSGRLAMCRTAAATSATSIIGSARMLPSACGTPRSICAASSVRALPMSICPAAMENRRPSSASVRVSPVMACFVVV